MIPPSLRAVLGRVGTVARLACAGFLLWVLAADTGARMARLQLAALPGFDYLAEVRTLREQGRFAEAILVADAGLRAVPQERDPALHQQLAEEKAATRDDQESLVRRLKDVARGALTGRGDSLESLVGAITTDMLVVGDVRDLLIEGAHFASDAEADEVTVLLSAVGLGTTLTPATDWVPAVLKAARKGGALTTGFSDRLLQLLRGRKVEDLARIGEDMQVVVRRSSPAGAVRVLRHADDLEDLRALTAFVDRNDDGVFALMALGDDGAAFIKSASRADAAPAALRIADDVALKAAAKGRAGGVFLRTDAAARLLRPHPLVGVLKSVWKGNAQALISRLVAPFDRVAWWLMALLAGWIALELTLLLRPKALGHSRAARRE